MNEHLPDDDVDAALRTLRAETAALETPHAVEAALLAAFAQQHARQRRPRWWRQLAVPGWRAGIGMATLAGAVVTAMLTLSTPPQRPTPAQLAASTDEGAEFIALDSAERIALEPAPRLVETEVSRTSLAALGVPLSPDNAGDLVRAQFLVGADGQPLALRLLPALSHSPPDRG